MAQATTVGYNATTNKPECNYDATTATEIEPENATTGWRKQVNRRRRIDGTYNYHWVWITGSGSNRPSKYGGSINDLLSNYPERWEEYQQNSQKATTSGIGVRNLALASQ